MAKPARKSRNETVFRETASARSSLLRAAKKLFARRGLSGTGIRDIAQEARVNSSQISYYFEGKEGLYRACIEDIAQTRLRFAEQILQTPKSEHEFEVRLRLFVENIINHFLEDQEAGLIIIREYDRAHSPAESVFKTNFIQLLELIRSFFAEAIQRGFINKKLDPFITMSLFFGTIMNELRFDHIKQDVYKRSLQNEKERQLVVNHIVDLFARN